MTDAIEELAADLAERRFEALPEAAVDGTRSSRLDEPPDVRVLVGLLRPA